MSTFDFGGLWSTKLIRRTHLRFRSDLRVGKLLMLKYLVGLTDFSPAKLKPEAVSGRKAWSESSAAAMALGGGRAWPGSENAEMVGCRGA